MARSSSSLQTYSEHQTATGGSDRGSSSIKLLAARTIEQEAQSVSVFPLDVTSVQLLVQHARTQ